MQKLGGRRAGGKTDLMISATAWRRVVSAHTQCGWQARSSAQCAARRRVVSAQNSSSSQAATAAVAPSFRPLRFLASPSSLPLVWFACLLCSSHGPRFRRLVCGSQQGTFPQWVSQNAPQQIPLCVSYGAPLRRGSQDEAARGSPNTSRSRRSSPGEIHPCLHSRNQRIHFRRHLKPRFSCVPGRCILRGCRQPRFQEGIPLVRHSHGSVAATRLPRGLSSACRTKIDSIALYCLAYL